MSTNSFVLRDTASLYTQAPPAASFGRPVAAYALSPEPTLYVYPYDVARRLDYPRAPWPRT